MLPELIGFVNLFCVGVLAGEEFVVRFGIRAPVASLDERPQIQLRQSLIRRLRVVVPSIFGLALLSGIAATALGGPGVGFGFRCGGLLALLAFISITLAGTVPINKATLTWEATSPPKDWKAMVGRWERLDTLRTWAALAAFALFLAATALH
jgi:uncharacterized membrane protein